MRFAYYCLVVVAALVGSSLLAACGGEEEPGGGEEAQTEATKTSAATVQAETPAATAEAETATAAVSSAPQAYKDAVEDWFGIYASARTSWYEAGAAAGSATDSIEMQVWKGDFMASTYALKAATSRFSPPEPPPDLVEADIQLRHGIDLVDSGADLMIEGDAASSTETMMTGVQLIELGHGEVVMGFCMALLSMTRAECEGAVEEILEGSP